MGGLELEGRSYKHLQLAKTRSEYDKLVLNIIAWSQHMNIAVLFLYLSGREPTMIFFEAM